MELSDVQESTLTLRNEQGHVTRENELLKLQLEQTQTELSEWQAMAEEQDATLRDAAVRAEVPS
jgi:hypothetical protein